MKRSFRVFMVPFTALGLCAGIAAQSGGPVGLNDRDHRDPSRSFEVVEATIPELQKALENHVVTSRTLVQIYLARIDPTRAH